MSKTNEEIARRYRYPDSICVEQIVARAKQLRIETEGRPPSAAEGYAEARFKVRGLDGLPLFILLALCGVSGIAAACSTSTLVAPIAVGLVCFGIGIAVFAALYVLVLEAAQVKARIEVLAYELEFEPYELQLPPPPTQPGL